MKTGKKTIYLADLTHNSGNTISSNTYPLGVGLVAASLLSHFQDSLEIEIFKYPQDLNNALSRKIPQVMGFSNYSWNCNLSHGFSSRIKAVSPETVIVFGGPNYSLEPERMEIFWANYPSCDFHIIREGELAMVELIKRLLSFNFSITDMKKAAIEIPNCHYIFEGNIIQGDELPRVDVNSIPSPYLLGLMDKFFNEPLMPLIYTTRGCPFKCTYCVEGDKYYHKVLHRNNLREEFEYLAPRVSGSSEIYITDANFGMFKEDIEKAKMIAEIQAKYHWPEFIGVCWGKNNPERLIETASILSGSVVLRSSLQSTDPEVLKNVQRSNISLKSIHTVATSNLEKNGDALTEIILGLPGDTMETHIKTLKDAVDAGFTQILVYQLSLLAQTVFHQQDYRKKYGIKTKFRNMPRSFGRFNVMGEEIREVEYEEICIETNTLSFENFINCRELDLTIEIIHNGGVFSELTGLCHAMGISWFDFILRVYHIRRTANKDIAELYNYFRDEAVKKLWDSGYDVVEYVKSNIDSLLKDEKGTNELTAAKSIAFFKLSDALHDVLFEEMSNMLKEHTLLDEVILLYLSELKEYSRLRKIKSIYPEIQYLEKFHFDFNAIEEQGFAVQPKDFMFREPNEVVFYHNDKQKERIHFFVNEYGTTIEGLGRILWRFQARKLFRQMKIISKSASFSEAKMDQIRSLNVV